MRRHLREYITNDLFCDQELPSAINRRFFPTARDLRNHIYMAMVRNRFSSCDQANVASQVSEWKKQCPKDKFFFRPYAGRETEENLEPPEPCKNINNDNEYADNGDDEVEITHSHCQQSLLFVHQTDWQRQLLTKYGNNICLLDATYRTTRYSLPLSFLMVETNMDYQVLASFVIQHETAAGIAEALQVIKDWNPAWNLQFFMTDLCEAEINAVEVVFPGN